jgi:NDP-sugar pyrophosphorylase family protein
MCIRDYQTQVPYGVVEIDEHRLIAIHEKPIQKFFVSAGIYVIEPDVLDFLAGTGRMDMPELFQSLMQANKETSVFPIREYWIDIGRADDYEKANGDYVGVFG